MDRRNPLIRSRKKKSGLSRVISLMDVPKHMVRYRWQGKGRMRKDAQVSPKPLLPNGL
jgi:hypothetical protein